jgi:LmbE family N-acetylglucosaminyl deacetylase
MHVFLSPHLDDAVLSCGATIHQLVTAGERVHIITVMAGDPPETAPDTPIVRTLHERWQADYAARRDEDICAAYRLRVSWQHLPLADCIYRTAEINTATVPLYPTEESLFGDPHPQDPVLTALDFVLVPNVKALYAPLGVGNHVDHQIVRDWSLRLVQSSPAFALNLYQEYPYTDDTINIERALAFYRQPLTVETVQVSEEDVTAKLDAIACYASQISSFWEDIESMKAATRRAMDQDETGVYVERYWKV